MFDASNLDPATSDHNYFDLMTNHYFNDRYGVSSYPSTFKIDGVEVYEDANTNEDVNHIYNLWAGVHATDNDIYIGWCRLKTEDSKTFAVKYAFSSFHANGGFSSHGTSAPSGSAVAPLGTAGYNIVQYINALGAGAGEINITGEDAIYMAIQHQDEATLFREIRVPLTTAGYSGVIG